MLGYQIPKMTFAKDAENYNENHLGVSVLVVYKMSRYGYFYLAHVVVVRDKHDEN